MTTKENKNSYMKLDLQKFRAINTQRAVEGFKTFENVPLSFWGMALAGELGELCNMLKKMERVKMGGIDAGNSYKAADITESMLEDEIGGIFIYLDLLSALLNINLEKAIVETFNNKSEQYNFVKYSDESPCPPQGAEDELMIKDYREIFSDHKRLVRELDVIINGENAAPQASLCDIVFQLRKEYASVSLSGKQDELWEEVEQIVKQYELGNGEYVHIKNELATRYHITRKTQ